MAKIIAFLPEYTKVKLSPTSYEVRFEGKKVGLILRGRQNKWAGFRLNPIKQVCSGVSSNQDVFVKLVQRHMKNLSIP